MSQYSLNDLERQFESFTAIIGANDDNEETAYLYRSEGERYIGCVTEEDGHYQWQPAFSAQDYTDQFITDLQCVIHWLKNRDEWLHTPIDEYPVSQPTTDPQRDALEKTSIPSTDKLLAASRSVCEEFIELFQNSDMRPERECHDLYERAKSAVSDTEGGAQ